MTHSEGSSARIPSVLPNGQGGGDPGRLLDAAHVRDLLCGIRHFKDLERGLPGISRALLSERLRRLERAGVLERRVADGRRGTDYQLTLAGRELQDLVDSLVVWGARWAFGEPDSSDLNPVLLLWRMRGRVNRDSLPPQQVVVQFDFQGARTGTFWMVLNRHDVSVCLQHPGFDIDMLVTADIATFFQVWLGRSTLAGAFLVRAFGGWWAWSPVADTVRATAARPITERDTDPH